MQLPWPVLHTSVGSTLLHAVSSHSGGEHVAVPGAQFLCPDGTQVTWLPFPSLPQCVPQVLQAGGQGRSHGISLHSECGAILPMLLHVGGGGRLHDEPLSHFPVSDVLQLLGCHPVLRRLREVS